MFALEVLALLMNLILQLVRQDILTVSILELNQSPLWSQDPVLPRLPLRSVSFK